MRYLLLASFALFACSSTEDQDAPQPNAIDMPAPEPAGGPDPLAVLRRNAEETAARPEVDVNSIRVEHILIAFEGASRSQARRSKAEAEQLTAGLLARATQGEDFSLLRTSYSGDTGPGIYTMSLDGRKGHRRQMMVPAFGDVGWRLEVGEIGVAAYHASQSPFGWHLIKRVE